MVDLGDFGGTNAKARAINEEGQIVGYANLPNDMWHAFITDGSGLVDLNTVLDASSAGWNIEYAFDINDRGQIVGRGWSPSGEMRGVLLTPVPEPSTFAIWSLLGIVGVGCGWWRKCRR